VISRILIAVLLASPAFADWVEYRSGPFHVFTDAGDKEGREALTRLEQLRHVLASQIGKPELSTIFPIDLVLFSNQKAYLPYALPLPLTEGGAATLAAWTADTPMARDLLRAITQRLIDENAGRMPDEIETGLQDLFSTIQVNATRVALGSPLPSGEISGSRLRAWAKLQMLTTEPAFSGKLRVYLNNLQQAGEEDTSTRNAFNLTSAQLEERVDAYVRAGKFESAPMIGRALNPNRDFIEKEVPKAEMDAMLAELKDGGKNFPPESPRGLLAKNTVPSLELAIKANPKWAEPQFKIATLETNSGAKIGRLKAAANLDPRNTVYWQTLAEAQAAAGLFADAEKSWTAAERSAPNAAARDRIHQSKRELQERRVEAELAERKRLRDEEARELENLKDSAAQEVRTAERAANERLAANAGNVKDAVQWYNDPTGTKVTGTLTRVDCMASGAMRLSIRPALESATAVPGSAGAPNIAPRGTSRTGGKKSPAAARAAGPAPVVLLIRDPNHLTVSADSGQAEFACGVQRVPRRIEVQHNAQADEKLGTAGDILVVKFP